MGILNDLGNIGSGIGSAISGAANSQNNNQSFSANGFDVPPIPGGSSGSGLPASNIQPLQKGSFQREIMTWYIPDVGIISMYCNPQNITYDQKKIITQERTKGGYSINYWGEELQTLRISGHTGSSGIEGLQVLEQIYRSEQILFDPIALTMASDNSITGLNDLVDSALGNLGGLAASLSSATTGLLGLNPSSQTILPQNIPSLAAMAAGIEMFYSGAVYRGFFTSFSYTEAADRLGLFNYDIGFTVSQKRGYRQNQFAWQRSAIYGPSNNSQLGGIPLSVSDLG